MIVIINVWFVGFLEGTIQGGEYVKDSDLPLQSNTKSV